jgi:hypothetical protein
VVACKQLRVFGESDVVANSKAEVSILRLKNAKLGITWDNKVALIEGDSPGNIHIKQVLFAVLGRNLSLFIEAKASVRYLVLRNCLWN